MNSKLGESAQSPIEKWLGQYDKKTREAYESRFAIFLKWANSTPEELVALREKQIQSPSTEGQMSSDLKRFYRELREGKVQQPPRKYAGKVVSEGKNLKYEPKSAIAIISSVRQFFKAQGRMYTVDFDLGGREASPKVQHRKYSFQREELQKILALVSVREKSLLLLGASSGWASGDILNLKKAEAEAVLSKPEHIGRFTRQKTQTEMYLCLTEETARYLRLYLQTASLKEYLFEGYKGKLTPDAPDLILKNACEKLGIKPVNEKEKIRFHCLRSYFDRTASKAGMAYAAIEECMGHGLQMDGAYKQLPEQDVWEQFKKAEPALAIEPTVARNGLEKVVQGLQEQLSASTERSLEEIQNFSRLENLVKTQQALIDALEEKVKKLGK